MAEVQRKKSVLVVEDDDMLRRAIVRALTREGFDAVPAADPFIALVGLLAGKEYDLVLTDFHMPGMTGAQLSVAIRVWGIEVPMVLMSAEANDDELATAGYFLAFLRKPFEMVTLVAAIRSIFSEAA